MHMFKTCPADLGGLVGQPVHQVGMQVPCRQHPGTVAGDPEQVGHRGLVDGQEGVEHGGDQEAAPSVRLLEPAVGVRVGLGPLPLAGLRVDAAQGAPQRPALAGRLPELLGQFAQPVLAVQVAAGRGHLVPEHLGQGEVLEQGHDVGERLVEGEHVGVARLVEPAVHAVQQGVGRLVGDDVVRQAGEHGQRDAPAPPPGPGAGK